MSHSPDATSDDTPRTDAIALRSMNSNDPRQIMQDLATLCRELERDLAMMRYAAAEPHYIAKVKEVLGPLSLWDADGLEKMVQARIASARSETAPSTEDIKDAARWRALKELAGYFQDGSQQTVKLYQDDALRSCFIEASGKTYGTDGSSFNSAIDEARGMFDLSRNNGGGS